MTWRVENAVMAAVMKSALGQALGGVADARGRSVPVAQGDRPAARAIET
jgi:hypothetical protein